MSAVADADTFRDEFSAESYTNNDGSHNWAGPWVEVGDDGSPSGGDIDIRVVTAGANYAGLRVAGSNNAVYRSVDLTGYTSASLSFTFRRRSFDSNSDFVTLEISSDGGSSWNQLVSFAGGNGNNYSDPGPIPYSQDISAYLSADTRIRFSSSSSLGDSDRVSIDDLQIEALGAVPSGGLLAEYYLDELSWSGAAGEVQDNSGNGNHAVALGTGQGVTTVDNGQVCRAGFIPANSSDGEQWAVDTGLDIDSDVGRAGHINFWYRAENDWNGGGTRMLFDASTTTDNKYFFLALLNSGRLQFGVEDSSDDDFRFNTPVQSFGAGEWVHIAVNWDLPADSLQIWINGSLAASDSINSTGSLGQLGTLYLGDNRSTYHPLAGASGGEASADGSLDEVRIYNQVRSQAQIVTDRDATHPCPLQATPVGEWQMEQQSWSGSAGEVLDESGNNLHGTMTTVGGTAATTDNANPAIAGNPGTCRYGVYQGANTGYVQVPDDPLLDIGDELTVTAWIHPQSLPGGGLMTIASKDTNYEFHINSSAEINWWWGGGARELTTSGANIQAGQWTHVAIVYSQSSGEQRIYVDGTALASGTNGNNALSQNDRPFYIGTDYNFDSRTFDGYIDEVRVYNDALSQAQVAAVMNATHPCVDLTPLAQYRFEEASWDGSAGQVQDSSGNGYNGTALGTASGLNTISDGYVCRGMDVPSNTTNGEQWAVDTGIDVDNDIGNVGHISLWYRSDTDWNGGGDRTIFDASTDDLNNSNDKYFSLALLNNGVLRFGLEDDNEQGIRSNTAPQSFAADTWVHLAVNWDLVNDRQEVYINGSLVAATTVASSGALGDLDSLYLGDNRGNYHPAGSSNSANGTLDEVYVFNRTLDQSSIQALMGQSYPCTVFLDHFAIGHSGSGITCLPTEVTITAHDSGHTAVDPGTVTVDLSTSTGRGDWSAIVSGSGTLNDASAGDGAATYTFPGNGESAVTLALNYTDLAGASSEVVNLNATTGSASEDNAEDPDLTVSLAALRVFNQTDGTTQVPTQLAGKLSDEGYNAKTLWLQALRASDSDTTVCEAAFPPGTVNIELGAECRDPASCAAGYQLEVTDSAATTTAIATSGDNASAGAAAYTTVPLQFGANAAAPIALRYDDVGQLQLHARYNIPLENGSPSGDYMEGASNDFVVRPLGLALDFTVAGADDRAINGTGGASYAADANGSVFVRAGGDFTATVTAVAWQSGDDSDNDGAPDAGADLYDNNVTPSFANDSTPDTVTVTHTVTAPSPSVPGALSNTNFSGFAGGRDSNVMQYSEVGILQLDAGISDGDYLNSGDNVVGQVSNVGRFYPDRFSLAPGALTNRAGLPGCGSSFSYLGEDFEVAFTLTAVNVGGGATRNYRGGFAKLDAAGEFDFQALDQVVTDDLTGRTAVSGTVPDPIVWNNGQLTLSALLTLARPVDETAAFAGPYEALVVGIDPQDEDGVQLPNYDLDVDRSGSDDHAQAHAGTTALRYGRLRLHNAYGPETADLRVPVAAEYFDGSAFVTHTDDSCTPYDDSVYQTVVPGQPPLLLSGFTGNLASGETSYRFPPAPALLVQGESPLSPPSAWLYLTAPGMGNDGSVVITLSSTDDHLPSYLRYPWPSHCAGTPCGPRATISFGHYRGHDRIIYIRERHE